MDLPTVDSSSYFETMLKLHKMVDSKVSPVYPDKSD